SANQLPAASLQHIPTALLAASAQINRALTREPKTTPKAGMSLAGEYQSSRCRVPHRSQTITRAARVIGSLAGGARFRESLPGSHTASPQSSNRMPANWQGHDVTSTIFAPARTVEGWGETLRQPG